MPEPSRIVIEQDPEDPLINRFRVALEEVVREQHSEEPAPPAPPPPSPPKRIREAKLGPIDIRIDLGPFMKGLEVLHTVYNNLVATLTGPELMSLIDDLVEGKRQPVTDFEHAILRAIRGATRFERIDRDL